MKAGRYKPKITMWGTSKKPAFVMSADEFPVLGGSPTAQKRVHNVDGEHQKQQDLPAVGPDIGTRDAVAAKEQFVATITQHRTLRRIFDDWAVTTKQQKLSYMPTTKSLKAMEMDMPCNASCANYMRPLQPPCTSIREEPENNWQLLSDPFALMADMCQRKTLRDQGFQECTSALRSEEEFAAQLREAWEEEEDAWQILDDPFGMMSGMCQEEFYMTTLYDQAVQAALAMDHDHPIMMMPDVWQQKLRTGDAMVRKPSTDTCSTAAPDSPPTWTSDPPLSFLPPPGLELA
jgi:hypothetical protein